MVDEIGPSPRLKKAGSSTERHRHVINRRIDERAPLLSGVSGGAGGDNGVMKEEEEDEWKGLPWWKRPSVFWLLPLFCLFTMAFGAVAVPRLNIILDLICKDYLADKQLLPDNDSSDSVWSIGGVGKGSPLLSSDGKTCQEIPEVQKLMSKFTLYMNLISGTLSVVTSPWLGSFSDRHGRRIILAISSLGLLSSEIATILAAKFPQFVSVNFILVGSVVDGLSGSFLLGTSIAHAYAADSSSITKRAVNFGFFQGALFLGVAVGPGLGGYIIKQTGDVLLIFYLAIAAHSFFIAYCILILPESLSPARIQKARAKHEQERVALLEEQESEHPKTWYCKAREWNPFEPLGILWPTGQGSSPRLRANLVLLAATDTLLFGVVMGGMTVIIMYAEFKFGWHNYESSVYLSYVNSTRVALLFTVVPLIVHLWRRYKKRQVAASLVSTEVKHAGEDTLDIVLIRFSVIVDFLGYLFYALAQNGTQFTIAGMITSLGGVGSPTLQSSMTKHIPSDKVGQLLGATALLHSIARVISPAVFNTVYLATVKTFPQTVFVCLASVFFVAFACSWFITPHIYLHEDGEGNMVDGEQGDAAGRDQ